MNSSYLYKEYILGLLYYIQYTYLLNLITYVIFMIFVLIFFKLRILCAIFKEHFERLSLSKLNRIYIKLNLLFRSKYILITS